MNPFEQMFTLLRKAEEYLDLRDYKKLNNIVCKLLDFDELKENKYLDNIKHDATWIDFQSSQNDYHGEEKTLSSLREDLNALKKTLLS